MRSRPADLLLEQFEALPAAAPLLSRRDALDGVHLVGGAVRDLMLGRKPLDLDLVVDRDLGEVIPALMARGQGHDRFETWRVELDAMRYDFARARRETYPRPGALPIVEPASLPQDLERRDFTVNAMALAIAGRHAGRLTAHPSAEGDLAARSLRVLHDRSFADDPTRLLRLARYASRLGFAIERHTLALVQEAIGAAALRTVTGSRIGGELRLLAGEPDPVAAFVQLRELGLDVALRPGFGLSDPQLARRALALLPAEGNRAALALAAAAIDLPQQELTDWLSELAFEADQRDTIVAAANGAPGLAGALEQAGRPSEIVAAVGRAPLELVALAGALGPAHQAREWLMSLRGVRLEIDGRDLLNAGLRPGPAVGVGLRAALAAKLDGRAEGRDAQLAEALRAAASSG